MADVTEIVLLFAQLASSLHRPINGELENAISSLGVSLNLTPMSSSSPGTRVLNAALSLMCFKASEVMRSKKNVVSSRVFVKKFCFRYGMRM